MGWGAIIKRLLRHLPDLVLFVVGFFKRREAAKLREKVGDFRRAVGRRDAETVSRMADELVWRARVSRSVREWIRSERGRLRKNGVPPR